VQRVELFLVLGENELVQRFGPGKIAGLMGPIAWRRTAVMSVRGRLEPP